MKKIPLLALLLSLAFVAHGDQPNIVLIMSDDQGWGQTGYNGHPLLKTPHLDAMAANGLRFNRFYAGAPVCSPTRASVLTGRCNNRTGVPSHGHALRLQEKTLPAALKRAGYATGHFGKWHLNAVRGPGVPILKEDPHGPRGFGFDEWLSVTNFFDWDPLMSRKGTFEAFTGDSSEIIVAEALRFIEQQATRGVPSFTVIWYGTPHNPFKASEEDKAAFSEFDNNSQEQHGELVAMDRSIGALRDLLRELDIAENTLVWFNSDNGGLGNIKPDTVGGLRGNKGNLYEGGIRVPGIIEWPKGIKTPRVTDYPACTMDIFPTVVDLLDLPEDALLKPVDGISLKPLFSRELEKRPRPIPFRFQAGGALIDNRYKLVSTRLQKESWQLYDLVADPNETKDLIEEQPEIAARMKEQFSAFDQSVEQSVAGKDYPEGQVDPNHPASKFWMDMDAYRPYFSEWEKRWEYQGRLSKKGGDKKKKKKQGK